MTASLRTPRRRAAAVLIAAVSMLAVSAARAPAQTPPQLIGKVYEGEFPIAGWTDEGGGLLQEPVWYAQYRRADGAQLVLSNWAQPIRPGARHTPFRVTDVLVVPPLAAGLELNFDCRTRSVDVTRKVIAVVRVDPKRQREWWRDVRQAWAISLQTGLFTPIATTGIECRNEGWGL